MADTPTGRKKNVTGQGKDVYTRDDGLGTGPVGSAGGYSGRPDKEEHDTDRAGSSGLGMSLLSSLLSGKKGLILIVLLLLIFGGSRSGFLSSLFGGGGSNVVQTTSTPVTPSNQTTSYSVLGGLSSLFGSGSGTSFSGLTDLTSAGTTLAGSSSSSGWSSTSNEAKLDEKVDKTARDRFTTIKGNGKDTVTIMVYMCGTDLESSYGMGSKDMQEMAKATIGSNVNLLVYTGGCKKWKTNGISNTTNQIYKVETGKLVCVQSDVGNKVMVTPSTLSEFIQYCSAKYPANRNMLIFWDHGGGSLSGYGYDEKNASKGSMTLSGIKKALTDGGIKFDFIGFDACLMATAETAIMLSDYADYMIASEETEPGIGWYYTDWLTQLSANTSMSTLKIGKNIVDGFVDTCATQCRGQGATLSVVDLAELEATFPDDLKNFATATSAQIKEDYSQVSKARGGAREFATSTRIDQVDLVDLANRLGTDEAKELANTIRSAVKYNRTSSNMTNAYGLSIYFPYQKVGKVDSAVQTMNAAGIDSEYSRCIQAFAAMQTGGQAISGGSASPLGSLFSGYTSSGQTATSSSDISSLLGGLLSGSYNNVSGLSSLTSGFLGSALSGGGRSLEVDEVASYLEKNRFDASALDWVLYEDGVYGIYLPDDQWKLVQNIELNVFYEYNGGYIDLGLDNSFTINKYGVLQDDYENTWIAINNQPVPYYYESMELDGNDYVITGRVPMLLNGELANLIIVFDSKNGDYVAGARFDYKEDVSETVAKNLTEMEDGDVIDFVCDFYDKDMNYQDSYKMGDQLTVKGELKVSDVYLPDASKVSATYRITDIYNQQYWTPVFP